MISQSNIISEESSEDDLKVNNIDIKRPLKPIKLNNFKQRKSLNNN